jgi:hypothetical protein
MGHHRDEAVTKQEENPKDMKKTLKRHPDALWGDRKRAHMATRSSHLR